MLDRVLSDRRAFHARLEQWRGLAQTLCDRSRRERREAEEGHMANDFDLVLHVRESDENVCEQLVQVKFRQGRVQLFLYHYERR